MRRYIRHPIDIPIEYELVDPEIISGKAERKKLVSNMSEGGLCFSSILPVPTGKYIKLRIPCGKKPLCMSGEVRWCHRNLDHYEIGVSFQDPGEEFRLRMAEQLCYIAHYQTEVAKREGRHLTGEEAADEWIEKYADNFPT